MAIINVMQLPTTAILISRPPTRRNNFPKRTSSTTSTVFFTPRTTAPTTPITFPSLPRIPRVKKAEDFWEFSRAGRALAELHLNYETVPPYPATLDSSATEDSHYHVVKMKHPKVKVDGKSVNDKTTIIYNGRITIKEIPEDAYRYVVNGKPAIDWVMERQCVKTDKDSGIVNDANLWARETMNNPNYPFELVLQWSL